MEGYANQYSYTMKEVYRHLQSDPSSIDEVFRYFPRTLSNIQNQLILICHAHTCLQRDAHYFNGTSTLCPVPSCSMMKQVLHHIAACQLGDNCAVPHCISSKILFYHKNACTRVSCKVCAPVRTTLPLSQNIATVEAFNSQQAAHSSQFKSMVGAPYGSSNVFCGENRPYPDCELWQTQRHLIMVLHCSRCERQEYPLKGPNCELPYCRLMKNTLRHMCLCPIIENCVVPYCSTTRKIYNHWRECANQYCDVCLPVRTTPRIRLFGEPDPCQPYTLTHLHSNYTPVMANANQPHKSITPVQQAMYMTGDVRTTEDQIHAARFTKPGEIPETYFYQQNTMTFVKNETTVVSADGNQSSSRTAPVQQTEDIVGCVKGTEPQIIGMEPVNLDGIGENFREILEQDLVHEISREKVLNWLNAH